MCGVALEACTRRIRISNIGGWSEDLHALSANILVSLVLVHVLAGLAHHFIRRDGFLHRMLP